MLILLIITVILFAAVTAATVSLETVKKQSLDLAVEAAEVKAYLCEEAAIAAEKAMIAAKMEQLARIRKVNAELSAHRMAFTANTYEMQYFTKHWRVKNALECHTYYKDCLAEAARIQSRAMKRGKYGRKEKASRKIWIVRASYWRHQKEYWMNSIAR